MNTITYRVKPKFAGNVAEVLSQGGGREYESKITLHGGKFTPEEIEQCLADNPDLKVQIDIGQKVRLSGVFVDGSAPREIDHETFLSVKEGDIVDIFFDAEFAKRYSLEVPGFPVLVLNQKRDFELINQIVLGDGDCVLRKKGRRFEVEKTRNGKIFSNHGITEPARINNRRDIFTEKDLEILEVIKNHRDQVTDIVISFISNASHVDQLHKTLKRIFGDKLPEVTYKIETLEAIGHLPYILKDSEDYGLKPKFVIGCGDLEAQVREDLIRDSYFGMPSEQVVREALEEKIESIIRFLSQRGIKELSIAWGLGEDDDTTYKLRKIIGLEICYGVKINYWVTKATIGKSKGAEVVGVLDGIMGQRKEVIKGLLTELTGNVAGSNI